MGRPQVSRKKRYAFFNYLLVFNGERPTMYEPLPDEKALINRAHALELDERHCISSLSGKAPRVEHDGSSRPHSAGRADHIAPCDP